MPRKRTRDEMEASEPPAQSAPEVPLITKIRNMWEFSSVMQFIHTFGKAVRIDNDFDIQDFEEECLKPVYSERLEEIGLTLLKWISSFRGLELSNWDDYTRRQYIAKAPQLNPYGDEDEPKRFRDFDIFLKIRVLHQLTVWTFYNPDRMRERMPDQTTEARQTEWRVEEFGWDRDDRTYYLLDDDRLYRRTDPPLPAAPKAKPKASSKKAQAARRRASKRARLEASATPDVQDEEAGDDEEEKPKEETSGTPSGSDVNTLGGYTWECVAITLAEYQALVESFKRTKDPNEQALRDRLIDEVIPVIEAGEEKQRRKIERRERELLAMEKMATAKRSSRIAGRHEKEKADREAQEAERKHAADLAAAHREQEKQEQMENERQSRMMTREQRIKDREYKRLLAEEELAAAAAEQEAIERGEGRPSRHVKDRLARNKAQLDEINNLEDDWTFDCSGCGVHGKNVDDGSHSISCERCSVWQHSKCLKISEMDAEREDFQFICKDCRRKEERAKQPKISIKLKNPGLSSSSPPQPDPAQTAQSPRKYTFSGVEVPRNLQRPSPNMNGYQSNPASYGPRPPSAPQNGYNHPNYSPNPATQRQYPFVISPYQTPGSPPPPIQAPYGYPPLQPGQQWGYPPPQQPYQRPGSSGQPYAPPQANGVSNGYTYTGGYPQPYPQNYQATPGVRPSSSGANSRPTSSHGQVNGQTPAARLPSPVINRPGLSPSQGNYDVGPVAGIPPYTHSQGHRSSSFTNGTPAPNARQPSHSSSPPMSGLSPSKNPTPLHHQSTPQAQPPAQAGSIHALPPPSAVPIKHSASPAQSFSQQRSVSGTPIIPPTEKLAPSPEHIRQGPQPTPSKQDQYNASFGSNSTAGYSLNGSAPGGAPQGDVVMNGTQSPAPQQVMPQAQQAQPAPVPVPAQQVDQQMS